MKLKFWIAVQIKDHACYNLTDKTLKGLKSQIEKFGGLASYDSIHHVSIEYNNVFDLFNRVTGEGGGRHPELYQVIKTIYLDGESK